MKKNFCYNNCKQKIIFVFAVFLIIAACKQNDEKKSVDKNTISPNSEFISAVETNLPDAPGAEDFKMNCVTCHSARYVQMQPQFPEKTWEKIVDRMVKNYGAPISDSLQKNIVDYLVTIKGKK